MVCTETASTSISEPTLLTASITGTTDVNCLEEVMEPLLLVQVVEPALTLLAGHPEEVILWRQVLPLEIIP